MRCAAKFSKTVSYLIAFLVTFLTFGGFAFADSETRLFKIKIDGKAAGEMTMNITKAEDGSITTSIDTELTVNAYLVFTYRYSFHGKEVWKDGALLKIESSTNDNGTRYSMLAVKEGPGMRVRVNNQEKISRGEAWATTFWCLPDPAKRKGLIPLIDAESGKDVDGNLQFQGQQQTSIAGQNVNVNKYKVFSKSNTDLWFDGTDRIVKQSWLEDGHKVEVEMSSLKRN
jgi:hypothetical protein